MAFDPAGTPVAFGDDLIFTLELAGGLLEGFLAEQLTLAVFVAEREIPVLREFLREL